MRLDFDNIFDHVIPIDTFNLNWRFTDEKYNKLPEQHLEQLKPLDKEASKFLSDYILRTNLHEDFPFKNGFFRTIDKVNISYGSENDIRKWLYRRGLAFDKPVYLSWDQNNSMIVPWKLLIKYFDSFYYPSSDDLTIIDQSLNWSLLFFHENEIYFGKNKDFIPSNTNNDIDLI